MRPNEAIEHLEEMKWAEEREAESYRAHAERGAVSSKRKQTCTSRAAQHEARALALGLAIAALRRTPETANK
jgi:hypothetical protein